MSKLAERRREVSEAWSGEEDDEEWGRAAFIARDTLIAAVAAGWAAREAVAYGESASAAAVFAARIKRNRSVRTDGRARLANSTIRRSE